MMNRLLMRKTTKSCRSCCEGVSTSPPCYDCTFSLQRPPPQYTSLAKHGYSPTPPLTPTSPNPQGFYLDPSEEGVTEQYTHNNNNPGGGDDASPYTMASLMTCEDVDFEVARLAQGVGRIAVAFLSDGQRTENVRLPGGDAQGVDISSNRRRRRTRHRSSPASHTSQGVSKTHLSRSASSAPQLRVLATSQVGGSRTPGRRLSAEGPHHMLLTALTCRFPDHLLQVPTPLSPGEVLSPRETSSPLPCQLLVPE